MRLEGKIALITGAGSGIGRALACEMNARGARAVLVGRRTCVLEETRSLLARPQSCVVIRADITDAADRERLVRQMRALAGLDILINNAGVVMSGLLQTDDAEARRRMVETNLLAPMDLTQALLPLLKAHAPSRIVNVGSMFGDIAFPYFGAYSATKFAIRGWSDALRRELAPLGIGVTYAAPRGTRTPAADGFRRLVDAFDMSLDPPEKVAYQIARAIAADVRFVYPRGPERLSLFLQRLMPRVIDQAVAKQMEKALQRLTAHA